MSELKNKIADIIWSQKPGGGDHDLCLKTADRIILELRLESETCPIGDGHRIYGHLDNEDR